MKDRVFTLLATLEIVAESKVVTGFFNMNNEFVECSIPERAVMRSQFRKVACN